MMNNLLALPAFFATIASITGLTFFAKKLYKPNHPQTISEMATLSNRRMLEFRLILIPCSILFGITLLFLVAPKSHDTFAIIVAALAMCISEIVLSVIPARSDTMLVHNILGYIMGTAMLWLVVLFARNLSGSSSQVELVFIVAMTLLGLLVVLDRKRVIFYELPFIYLSHSSILVAALGKLS